MKILHSHEAIRYSRRRGARPGFRVAKQTLGRIWREEDVMPGNKDVVLAYVPARSLFAAPYKANVSALT